MACPFFLPTKPIEHGPWPHPARLPLGSGWEGLCTATAAHTASTDQELTEHCNLGYARCSHLPADRFADAVRFAIAAANETVMVVTFVCERDHLPGEHGTLEFCAESGFCAKPHSDERIQRLAACYVHSQIARKRTAASDPSPEQNTLFAEGEKPFSRKQGS